MADNGDGTGAGEIGGTPVKTEKQLAKEKKKLEKMAKFEAKKQKREQDQPKKAVKEEKKV